MPREVAEKLKEQGVWQERKQMIAEIGLFSLTCICFISDQSVAPIFASSPLLRITHLHIRISLLGTIFILLFYVSGLALYCFRFSVALVAEHFTLLNQ